MIVYCPECDSPNTSRTNNAMFRFCVDCGIRFISPVPKDDDGAEDDIKRDRRNP